MEIEITRWCISMIDVLHRELVYIAYYFELQLMQILRFWVLGIVLGSVITVFGKQKIHTLFDSMRNKRLGLFGIIPASLFGIASPLCMYGTIPIAASFSEKGMRHDWLAAFMMSSVLLNPQLMIYSAALGMEALFIRVVSCCICGMTAGLLVHIFYKDRDFFSFGKLNEPANRDTDPNLLLRLLKNMWRNIKATGPYFLAGILLSALFQRYVPSEAFAQLFGKEEGFGVLLAATIGVPLYVCGGGTIPLLQDWLRNGMSMGSAAAFMVTGPATKITNLGALKIVMGIKHFALYILFVMIFSLMTGLLVNMFV